MIYDNESDMINNDSDGDIKNSTAATNGRESKKK